MQVTEAKPISSLNVQNMMSLISLLEMFTNPFDLEFVVGESTDNPGTWILAIMRGSGHNGKPILSGEKIPSKESAIATIVKVLNAAVEKGTEVCKTPAFNDSSDFATDLLKAIVNPDTVSIEEARGVLRPEMVLHIEQELNETGQCTTYTWGVAV